MDILFKNVHFVFSYRVGGILKHNGKILLQRPKNDDYAIIGGHVAAMETSMETLKREFEEELHAKIEVDNLLAIGEINFPWGKRPCHQICLYYNVHLMDDRNGSSKEEIKEYIEREFHYNLDRTLDEIRPGYHMDETCQRTVPEAMIAFLESQDFEDAIRNAVSLGGDTDTLGAITGSIAEAFYGIPAVLIAECRSRMDEGLMTDILDEFDHVLGRDRNGDS